jgi:chromosomal replication initiator protein
VIAAGSSPRTLGGLDERLRSHFQMGLIADLRPPEYDSRLAIVRARVAARGVSVPAAVLEQLARRVSGSVRELEGAVNQLLATAELSRGPLSLGGINAALAALAAPAAARVRPSAGHVLRAVCATFGVSADALAGKRRDREIVLPRQVAMALMRELTGASLSEIGATLGGRDHSTVLHGCEKVAALLAAGDELRTHYGAARQLALEGAAADAASRAAPSAAAP